MVDGEYPIGIMLLFIRHPSACCIQIFYNVAEPGKTSLSLQNFVEMLPEDKAMKAFALFEVSDEGTISKKALVKWVVNVYKERKALSLTLSDNRTVVAKLHRVLDVVGQFNLIQSPGLQMLFTDDSSILIMWNFGGKAFLRISKDF